MVELVMQGHGESVGVGFGDDQELGGSGLVGLIL